MKKSFSDIIGDLEADMKRRLALKVPSWSEVEGLEIPSKLALEQCSSEKAAIYKAALAPEGSVADLDSGLGVDDWAFARKAGKVWYNEINPELAACAERNFARLGLKNIECSCMDAAQRLASLPEVDMIFLDPARRDKVGHKMFLLEDCSPNVPELMPELWKHTGLIMLKLSPMADIAMVAQRLEGLCEVHIVGLDSECKELLCILKKGWSGDYRTIAAELSSGSTMELGEGKILLSDVQPAEGEYLLEPSAILQKSGRYGAICERFSVRQLDRSTHLFTTGECISSPFFKTFRITENVPFNKAGMKRLGRLHPNADVTARNLPLNSEDLKKKMGIAGSGEAHIFGTSVLGERRLLVCEKVTGPESVV